MHLESQPCRTRTPAGSEAECAWAMSDFQVAPLTARELARVRDLHAKLLPVQYPVSFFIHLLVIPSRACYVAYSHGSPVGFISAALHNPTRCFISGDSEVSPRLEILTLGVLPAFQHRGLARRLIMSLVNAFKQDPATPILIYANVSTTNTRALQFYERMGILVSSDIITNLYRTLSYGSRDAYLVVGAL
uniref:N-acetyltransferase domain-containing protein n=1 Tax=Psilocybe cubensis TaxID=181762 RepID=A0A8H8CP67_PSICU